ncbi:ThuA domain-containing protein, partial [Pseudokineococcus sp. 5B2Z-1]|uniref:ThuA domain-containing protein n=1 Tax=Pseudokineococcus sp. 5B2Z-1 TaxID=3132744 RepID=UPI0030B07901
PAAAAPAAAADQAPGEAPGTTTAAASGEAVLAPPAVGEGRFDVLVFSKTAGFRHGSIEEGIAAIELLGEENDFGVTATEDASVFTEEGLAPYEAVVWLSTTGDVLNDDQQAAFEAYITQGGGYAGVHSASDTEYDWEFYGDLVGAYFSSHPAQQSADVLVEDPVHPSTADLPTTWNRFDEWYNFRTNPREDVHVLASLEEDSYDAGGGAMGDDHPIAWCQEVDAGRSWYTALGHTEESFVEEQFLGHLLGGIETAAGAVGADCTATSDDSFEKVSLDENTSNPMELDVADDGRVYYIERNGEVLVIEPSGAVRTLLELDVTTVQEFGLLGIVLDPDFAENGWMYLYWSPTGSDVDRVSRVTVEGEGASSTIDPASEVTVLEVPVQRAQCCHAGGAMAFDTQGDLYIATGDNTNPFESQGYAPLDEREGRSAFDSQRTSGNTNDLRGKVLRITPQDDGSYTIPEGNLFEPGTELTRPEIYGMGFRNPFRIGVDPLTDQLMVADYGPDAGSSSAARGPDGRVEWQILQEPGNYGWPYCHADNAAYEDWDFATNTGSGRFDCDDLVNDSPNNTGLTELPPAIPAQIWYGREATSSYPGIGTGGAPMAGPAYVYDPELESSRKWPAYFSDKALLGEWNTGQLYTVQLSEDRLSPLKVTELLPEGLIIKPMAWDWGPDGALYMIDWGSGFGGNNDDSGVYRIDYLSGSRAPVASATADVTSGPLPLEVTFSSEGTFDPNGTDLTYAWDLDGDGTVDSTEADPTFIYTEAGAYQALLTVTNEDGRSATVAVNIAAGNTRPTVDITGPVEGGFTEFGDTVEYAVEVTDPEDDAAGVDTCAGVVVKPALGHNDHGHPGEQENGCTGEFVATIDDSHGPEADVFVIVEADYTDAGADGGAPALTGSDLITLQPKTKQAEYFEETGRVEDATGGGDPGVQRETTGDSAGGFQNIGYVEDGDYVAYSPVNLTGIDAVTVRAASPGAGATAELRWDAADGPLVGTVELEGTGGWQQYAEATGELTDVPEGTGTLFVVFRSTDGATGSLVNVNWFEFEGKGVSANSAPTLDALTATPSEGPAPLPVTLSAEVSDLDGDDVIGSWTTGIPGDAPREGLTTEVVYEEVGDYTATFRATDSQGAFRTGTVTVSVEPVRPGPCAEGRSDEFDGTELSTCRWQVVRPEPEALSVADGQLELLTPDGDVYTTPNGDVTNLVLQPAPAGEFSVTTKLDTSALVEQYQQGGLIAYLDDDNYVKLDHVVTSALGADSIASSVELRSEVGAAIQDPQPSSGAIAPGEVWLRLSLEGTIFTGEWSTDGETWEGGESAQVDNAAIARDPELRVGVFTIGTDQSARVPVTFDFVRFTPDEVTPPPSGDDTTAPSVTASLEPAEPTGAEGWYTSPVTATVVADDGDGSGVETIEYQVVPAEQAGTWDEDASVVEYTEPVVVADDGDWAMHVRATDAAGNTSAPVVVDLRIDTTAPTATLSGVEDGTVYGSSELLDVALEAEDATSGLASTTLAVDGEEVGEDGVALWTLEPGEHQVRGTATDVAGNVTEVTARVVVEVTAADVRAVVGTLAEAGALDERTERRALQTMDRVDRFLDRGRGDQAVRQLEILERSVSRTADEGEGRDVLLAQIGYLVTAVEADPAAARGGDDG